MATEFNSACERNRNPKRACSFIPILIQPASSWLALAVLRLRWRSLVFPAEARVPSQYHRAPFGLLHPFAAAALARPLDSHEGGLALETALRAARQTGGL